MTVFKYIRILLMSLFWQMPRAKEIDLRGQTEISWDLNRRETKRKRLKKKREKLPPKERKLVRHHGFRNSKSKDARYSNQRSLRRMYRNT